MSEEIHRKIVEFLGKEFSRTEGRQCIACKLVYAQPGSRGDEIRTWDRAETPELFEGLAAIEGLSSEIVRLSQEHADSFGSGKHRFEVRITQHLGGRPKMSFMQYAESDGGEGDLGEDEPPTERGVLAQVMRHQEVTQRTLTTVYQSALGTMSSMIRDLSEETRALRTDRQRHLLELENARNEESERELAAHIAASAEERKDMALQKVLAFLPVAASRLIGGSGGSGGEGKAGDPGAAALMVAGELAQSLDQQQLMKLLPIFTEPQRLLLMEIFSMAKKHKLDQEQGQGQGKQAATG
jgi:hypothetical protein